MNLKDLLQFAGQEGKVVIAGEDGEVKGVFLSFAEYQRLAGVELGQAAPAGPDPEKVNREILDAQLTDTVDSSNKNLETISESTTESHVEPVGESVPDELPQTVIMPSPIKNILARRAKDLFMNQPYGRQEPPQYDLREEVMDPTFDEPIMYPPVQVITQPKVESDADEEIKPNFDDI